MNQAQRIAFDGNHIIKCLPPSNNCNAVIELFADISVKYDVNLLILFIFVSWLLLVPLILLLCVALFCK